MKVIESAALLVRSVAYGEADVVATFFTESDGIVGVVVRGARRSTKRFGGALEPIHEIVIRVEDRGRELGALKEARVTRPRLGVVGSLASMDHAGQALRWVRHLCPARTPEPQVWGTLGAYLDLLDARPTDDVAQEGLAAFGLRLLGEMGYGLDFERCVRCGKPCPEGKSAFFDVRGGGLVCMGCGGSRRAVGASVRSLAARLGRGAKPIGGTSAADRRELLDVVEEAMAAHADFGALKRGG